jgi:hypothetical protein
MQYDQLFSALSKAQLEIVGKAQGINPQYKSSYAKFEDVWEAIRKPFFNHGLCVVQNMDFHHDKWCIVTIIGHISGQFITSYTPIIDSSSAKNPSQAFGSAVTYAKKYALASACGFSVSDKADDDGEACLTLEDPDELALTVSQVNKLSLLSKEHPELLSALTARFGSNIREELFKQTQAFYHEMLRLTKKPNEPTIEELSPKISQEQIKEIHSLAKNIPEVKDELHRLLGKNAALVLATQNQDFYYQIKDFATKMMEFKNAS